jgi:tRNA nucleotidyltransferase (CCA-adding enzyme)
MKTLEKKISLDSIPEDIRQILNRFLEEGFDVWLVGGALRDFLWGWIPKDWDLATSASPQQVMELFPRVIPVGLRHGTVQIHTAKKNIEVTSCPSAGFEGIIADLQRRDFTVNALAFSYPQGQLIDPFGGQKDLLSRTLRSVGDAGCRFAEDPLRTLRAGRFMSAYGFNIDPQTFMALKEAAPGLQRVSRERIREEFFKMLLGEFFPDAFDEMVRGGVIQEFLPELMEQPMAAINHSPQRRRERRENDSLDENLDTISRDCTLAVQREQPLGTTSDTVAHLHSGYSELLDHTVNVVQFSPRCLRVRLAALFHHLCEVSPRHPGGEMLSAQTLFRESALAAAAIMRRLRTSHRQEQEVAFLVENQIPQGVEAWTEVEVRWFIARIGEAFVGDVMDLAYADRMAIKDHALSLRALQSLRLRISQELKHRPPLRIEDLAINGRDVMRILDFEPGPAVGEALRSLYRKVLRNPALNQPKILMDFLKREYDIKLRSKDKQENKGG